MGFVASVVLSVIEVMSQHCRLLRKESASIRYRRIRAKFLS